MYHMSDQFNHPWIHFFFVRLLPKLLLMQNNIQKSILFDTLIIKKCKDRLRTSVLESPIFDLNYFSKKSNYQDKPKGKKLANLYENFDYEHKHIWNREK